jgi:hypothetical protein
MSVFHLSYSPSHLNRAYRKLLKRPGAPGEKLIGMDRRNEGMRAAAMRDE